jgi:uncharacterized protein (TIGR00156 family)
MSHFNASRLIIAAVLAIGIPAAALAQYVGPSSQKVTTTVADILKNPVDDQEVMLRGVILKKISKEKYLFSDGKNEIRVEIDDRDFPAQAIDETTRIEIRGEVEKEFMESPEIDVKMINILR